MIIRKSSAAWEGTLKNGKGTMTIGNQVYNGNYSFASRFEIGEGTNPEELLAAAHAGCFSMALSANLSKAGFNPQNISTTAEVYLNKTDEGYRITRITLTCEAQVPVIDETTFQRITQTTKMGCPISAALNVAEIQLFAKLV